MFTINAIHYIEWLKRKRAFNFIKHYFAYRQTENIMKHGDSVVVMKFAYES